MGTSGLRQVAVSNANKLKDYVKLPSSVSTKVVRVNKAGDVYVKNMKAHYKSLAETYKNMYTLLTKLNKDSRLESLKVSTILSNSIKRANNRKIAANTRRNTLDERYALAKDVFTMINK